MAVIRIFSYLPNPRIMKANIAARLCGVEIEIRGDKPKELINWLWDFDARPLEVDDFEHKDVVQVQPSSGFDKTLHKTNAFLEAHPFGTVPAAFSPNGNIGIFESNSILRTVARLGQGKEKLYGSGPYEASRIDSFLDVSLVFARQSQIYLLALSQGAPDLQTRNQTANALEYYLSGIDNALKNKLNGLVNNQLSIADICFVCEICQISRESAHLKNLKNLNIDVVYDQKKLGAKYPRAMGHFDRLCDHPDFSPDISPFMEKLSRIEKESSI